MRASVIVVNRVKTFLTSSLITLQNTVVFFSYCVHAIGSPKISVRWGPAHLEWGRGRPFRNTLLYHLCYCAKFGNLVILGQTIRAWLSEIHQKNLTPRVPLFEVTQDHWSWHGSIGYIWLPINNACLSRTVSDINSDLGRKSKNFPTPFI